MHIAVVAGEPSGDLLGANLIQSLRQMNPNIRFTGVGGPLMIAAGCQSLYDIERLSVMGLIEPLFRLPELFKIRANLYKHCIQQKPDLFIGIDYAEFNLSLELKLKRAGIPVVHYVSPSVWAWRQKRVFKIKKAVDLMLTLFPFEADFYKKFDVPVKFVGHTLADQIPLQPDRKLAREKLKLESETTYVALLPGSRRQEIHHMAEIFIKTAMQILQKRPHVKFISSFINSTGREIFQNYCQRLSPNLPIQFFEGEARDVIIAADVLLVKSGTITLEAMLCKRPMVIAHRLAKLTYQIAKLIVKTKYVGLPNLLSDELCVPELIQDAAYPEAICAALINYLDDAEKTLALETKFTAMHQQLRRNASDTAAQAVLSLVTI